MMVYLKSAYLTRQAIIHGFGHDHASDIVLLWYSCIDKHVSRHCARHSCAVNLLNNSNNNKTVASIFSHSGLKHTEKYTRAVDKLKQDAINSLPELNI